MPDEPFEILADTRYRPEITERTEEEAKRGFLEGEEFMVVEVQAVGTAEISPGMDSFAVDYLAVCSEKALTSRWMEEKIRQLTKVSEDTVMAMTGRVRSRLFMRIRQQEEPERCLDRSSWWLSMGDDGSQRWSIRDRIDPVFEEEDRLVGRRAKEARRLAGIVMRDQLE